MNASQHKTRAEELIRVAAERGMGGGPAVRDTIALAQVHATLAADDALLNGPAR